MNAHATAASVSDYQSRTYLSAIEVAHYLGMSVNDIHRLVKSEKLNGHRSASGQYRFSLTDVRAVRRLQETRRQTEDAQGASERTVDDNEIVLSMNGTVQKLFVGDSRSMDGVDDDSVHLAITSPPYFNVKMYSDSDERDLGNVHNLDVWLAEIGAVWREVFRALQPGRKFFLNIMNVPIREDGSFRTLNLVGKSIDLCEGIGFVFKRDIVWHKTNGVRAHFGTYPYPGGILLNNMHESILEFQKPARPGTKKYAHVAKSARERSKLTKDFWLMIKNSDVWTMKPEKSGNSRNHVAPFPLELPQRLIKAYSYIGETVLDPFCGSGTTLVAAAMESRNGMGYELHRDFAQQARGRLLGL